MNPNDKTNEEPAEGSSNSSQESPKAEAPKFDFSTIPTVEPMSGKGPAHKPLSMVGFDLAKFILFIISGFLLFLILFLIFKIDAFQSLQIQIPTEAQLNDSTFQKRLELIKVIQEEKKNYRDFILQISQMVLLNLLLPILTAILGYIFAKGENNKTNN